MSASPYVCQPAPPAWVTWRARRADARRFSRRASRRGEAKRAPCRCSVLFRCSWPRRNRRTAATAPSPPFRTARGPCTVVVALSTTWKLFCTGASCFIGWPCWPGGNCASGTSHERTLIGRRFAEPRLTTNSGQTADTNVEYPNHGRALAAASEAYARSATSRRTREHSSSLCVWSRAPRNSCTGYLACWLPSLARDYLHGYSILTIINKVGCPRRVGQ